MKTTLSCALAAVALAATGLAMAQQSTVQIRASETKTISLFRGDFDDYANVYLLSNGRIIRFSEQQRHYYAKLDNGDRVELYPVSHSEFMTAAGARVAFRDSGDEVTISNYETLPMAGVTQKNVTLVASR